MAYIFVACRNYTGRIKKCLMSVLSLTVAVIILIMAILGSIATSRSRYSSPDNQTSSSITPTLERNEQNRIREVRLESTDTIESVI